MPVNVIDNRPIVCLEFFSGIGGLHYGLQQSGTPGKVVMSFDMNENANTVYEHNFGYRPNNKAIDYLELQDIDRHKANCWLLSPPCQPYTRGGKYLDDQDPRARGLIHLLQLLPQLKNTPDYLLLENVMNFENSRSRTMLVTTLGHLGFKVYEFLLSPVQLGIPNSRLRYFLVARREWPRPPSSSAEDSDELEAYDAWVAANKQRTDEYLQRGRDAVYTQWPIDLATGSVPANAADIALEPLASYIDLAANDDPLLLVPEVYILKRKSLEFDIVRTSSPSTSTFTKAYGSKHLIGSGSLLQTKRLDVVENGFKSPERLLDLGLRFFSPKEVALLHHFPYVEGKSQSDAAEDPQGETAVPGYTLNFPSSTTQKQRLQLLGNSLNVKVVAELLKQVLFSDTIR
ncbi:hypothetical protein GGH94_002709 [Coemansia aciculifera]|uniref:tRNA (cytosine(38)-C(5))-methyltransferase n=1 Tax=Coemansia aciculifera TaxID=417176 RepID=A0A9W8M6Y4_9FUNG|nr:hypothetical protein GGH94_002709 [Coemansia aciculifera]